MVTTLYIIHIAPSKTEAWRRFYQEILGRRYHQYQTARRRAGITRERVWLHPSSRGEIALILVEADRVVELDRPLSATDEPFDRWYRRRLQEIAGGVPAEALYGIEGELIFDWAGSGERAT